MPLLASKTFKPDVTWTPTGSAALVGSTIKLAATPSYSYDPVTSSEGIGQQVPGWTMNGVATMTIQLINAVRRVKLTGNNFDSVQYQTVFGDGCFRVQCAQANNRYDPMIKVQQMSPFNGYSTQFSPSFAFASIQNTVDDLAGNSLTLPDPGDNPTTPFYIEAQSILDTDGVNQRLRYWINNTLRGEWVDRVKKYATGLIAVRIFDIVQFGTLEFFPVLTGGFTSAVMTPYSVSGWSRLNIEWRNMGGIQTNGYSNVFQYSVDGGSTWAAVPDNGDISGAAVGNGTIMVRANSTLKNNSRATADITIDSVAVEINGQWDPNAAVPSPATGLKVTATTSASVSLSWTAPTTAPDSYNVYRCPASTTFQGYGNWVKIGSGVAVTNYTDSSPLVNQVAAYAVESVTGGMTGLLSNVVQAVAALAKNSGLDQMDYLFPIQKAIYSRLNGAVTDLSLKIVPVYSIASVPENLPTPYIVIGDVEGNKDASTKTRAGQEVVVTTWCFSEYLGTKEVSWIAGQITQLILQAKLSLVLDGLNVIISELLGSHNTRDPDGRTMIRGTRFRFVIMDLASQLPPKP